MGVSLSLVQITHTHTHVPIFLADDFLLCAHVLACVSPWGLQNRFLDVYSTEAVSHRLALLASKAYSVSSETILANLKVSMHDKTVCKF